MNKEWLTTGEVAKMMGISAMSVRRLTDSGKIPSYRFGQARRIKAADVENYIANAETIKEWLTTGEVAEKCGVRTQTVRDWIAVGKLPAAQRGGRKAVKKTDLDKFMEVSERL